MSQNASNVTVALSGETNMKLEHRAIKDDLSPEEVISDLLSKTRNTATLSEFVDKLVDEVNPCQIALYEDVSPITFVVNASPENDIKEAIEGIHAIEVDGDEFEFSVEHDPDAAQDLGRLSLYTTTELTVATDRDLEDDVREPVSREEGIENAKEWIRSNKTQRSQ